MLPSTADAALDAFFERRDEAAPRRRGAEHATACNEQSLQATDPRGRNAPAADGGGPSPRA